MRGEEGHQIISELSPKKGEPVIDKTGSSALYATDLEFILTKRGIKCLIVAGVTTDICVHSTLRSAIDMGYDCLLLEDCTAASVQANHLAAIDMIKQEGGYLGTVSTSEVFSEAMR